jgi:hypothetical protein
MAYMLYEQLTTAIRQAYQDSPELNDHLQQAQALQDWLAGLEIEDRLRRSALEPILALQAGFEEAQRHASRKAASAD